MNIFSPFHSIFLVLFVPVIVIACVPILPHLGTWPVFQMFFLHFLHLSFFSESIGKKEKKTKNKKLGAACNMNNLFNDSKYFTQAQKMVMRMKVIALKKKS